MSCKEQAACYHCFVPSARRFAPPWIIEEHNNACFTVRERQRADARVRLFRGEPGRRAAALFGLFAQADAGMRVHVMYLMTYRTTGS
jgi:hypothetical protein